MKIRAVISRIIFSIAATLSLTHSLAAIDPIASSAEYYYSRQEFREAYQLWNELLKRQPDNLQALGRVCELKTLFEGRTACRELLKGFLNRRESSLTPDVLDGLRTKILNLESVFVTDEGQTAYLQAMGRVQNKDCPGALKLLTHAFQVEKGNILIARQKARCEKTLQLYDQFYQTIKFANEVIPVDRDLSEQLSETHVYYRQFVSVVERVERNKGMFDSLRSRLAYGISLAELGKDDPALNVLQNLVDQERQSGVHPIAWFYLGQIFSKKQNSSAVAISYLEKFISSSAQPENNKIDGWDPYRATDRTVEAKKLLLSVKERMKENS